MPQVGLCTYRMRRHALQYAKIAADSFMWRRREECESVQMGKAKKKKKNLHQQLQNGKSYSLTKKNTYEYYDS